MMNRNTVIILIYLFTIPLFFPSTPYAAISYHIPLHSSLEEDIQTLHSLGYLDEIFSGSRPYYRMEVARAAVKMNGVEHPAIIKLLLKRIERELKEEIALLQGTRPKSLELKQIKIQSVVLDGQFSNGGLNRLQSIKYNNGRDYENGLNLYGGISLLARSGDSTLLYLEPEFQYAERDSTAADELYRLRVREGYFKYHTQYSDIMIGNVPLWWGQGYNGALILTDNIEPLTMFRFYKEEPFSFSLPFHQKGTLTYDFFVSRLEEDRELPHPLFWGMRVGFKPIPSWEIGIARTAMLGGGDRPLTLKTFAKSFTSLGENTDSEAGNQIGGFDTNFKGHLWLQPFNIYAELYGEDEAGLLPSRYAYLTGLHLPDIAGLPGNSLRIEYANSTGWPHKIQGLWYTHHIYTDGYTYKGRIIGHGMGSDADDFLIKWEKYFSADAKGSLSYERTRVGLFNPAIWEARDYSAGVELRLRERIELIVSYTFQKVDNFDFSPDKDSQNNEVWVKASFDYEKEP